MYLLRCMFLQWIVFAACNIVTTTSCTVATPRFKISVNTSKGCLKPLNASEGKDAVFLWDTTKKVDQVTIKIESLTGTELIARKWTLNGKELSDRYEPGKPAKSTITLKNMETMDVDDTGVYRVTALKEPSSTVNVTIGIESGPVIERKQKKMSVVKFPGDYAEIRCNVYGYPRSRVIWKIQDEDEKNTRNITSRMVTMEAPPTYSVRIAKVERSDRLWYICEASNKHGVRDTAQFLRVKDRLAWIIPLAVVIAQSLIIIILTMCYNWTEKHNSDEKPPVTKEPAESTSQLTETKTSVAGPKAQPAKAAATESKSPKSAKAPSAKAKTLGKISEDAPVDSTLQKYSEASATDLSGVQVTQSTGSDRKGAGCSTSSTLKYRGHSTRSKNHQSTIKRPGYAAAARISRRRTAYGRFPTVQFTPGTLSTNKVETEVTFGF